MKWAYCAHKYNVLSGPVLHTEWRTQWSWQQKTLENDTHWHISQLLSHVEVGCLANPGASKLNLVIKCFKITTHLIYLLNCITGTSLEVPNSYILKYRSYKRVAWLYVYRYWSSVRSEEMKSACTYIHVGGKLMYAVFYSLWCTYFTCLHNPRG